MAEGDGVGVVDGVGVLDGLAEESAAVTVSSPPSVAWRKTIPPTMSEHGNDHGEHLVAATPLRGPLSTACLLALVVLPRQLSLPLRAARHPCLLLVLLASRAAHGRAHGRQV